MLSLMESIYDVLRLLVSKGRGVLTDTEIAAAHAIIDRHEEARPVPAKAKAPQDDGQGGGQADG